MLPPELTYEAIDAQITRCRNLYWEVKDDFARNSLRETMNMLEYERDRMREDEARRAVPLLTKLAG